MDSVSCTVELINIIQYVYDFNLCNLL